MKPPPEDRGEASPARRDLIWLAALALLAYLPGIGSRDLWNPDEPRYAEVAREMLASGKFIVPHLNGEIYTQKPPLLFWSIAFFGWLRGGVDEVAARLPSLLAGVVAVLFVYLIGRKLFDRRVGLWSALIFGSSFKIIWQAHVGQIDMLLTALVTVAVYFWVCAWTEGRRGLTWLFFVFAGLATIAKGPVGLLPPLLSIVVFLVWRDRPALRDLRVGRGLLVSVAVVCLWLGPALFLGGEHYRDEILYKQNVQRYADPWHHHQPFYYFLRVLPFDFLPWSLLLPATILVAFQALKDLRRDRWHFLWIWVVVTLIFFSASPAKRTVYVLTLYPALALLVGVGLDLLARRAAVVSAGWWRLPMILLTGLCGLAALAIPFVARRRTEFASLGADLPWLVTVALLGLTVGFAWATREMWHERFAAFVKIKAAAFTLFAAFVFAVILPRFDPFKSARGLAAVLMARISTDEPYGLFPVLDSTFLFYTQRHAVELLTEEELHEFIERPGRVWLLVRRDELRWLVEQPDLVEVARDQDTRKGYILFGRPAKLDER